MSTTVLAPKHRTTTLAKGRRYETCVTGTVLVDPDAIIHLGRAAQLCFDSGGACTTTYANADELRAFGAMSYALAAELDSAAMVALANANEVTT